MVGAVRWKRIIEEFVEGSTVELLTPQEAAQFLKCSTKSIYELSRRRTQERSPIPIPAIGLHSKMLRFEKQALIDWVNEVANSQATRRR
jgi:hypothetical protein